MRFQLTSGSIVNAKVDGIILHLLQAGKKYPRYFNEIDKALGGALAKRLRDVDFKAEVAQVVSLNTLGKIAAKNVYVVGMGEETKLDSFAVSKAYAAAARKARSENVANLALLYSENKKVENFFQTAIEGILLSLYRFDVYKTDKQQSGIQTLYVCHGPQQTAAIQKQLKLAQVAADSTNLARDLVNRPGSDLYPELLAAACRRLFKGKPYTLTIWDEKEIKRRKMFAYLSVAAGSPRGPRFIHIKYKPAKPARKRIALVGKGVTFDTGGLSLKPARHMMDMKYDMAGAAAVIGAMQGLERLKVDVEVDGIVAATENIPGGGSTLPGDVVYAMNGKSIEVLNTDAEGRLTLADALSYACSLPRMSEVINIATLTGSCVVAVGDMLGAAMTNNEAMLQRLRQCGEAAGERYWQLPLVDDYRDHMKSDIADIKNIGEASTASTIIGGLFLQEFVKGVSWVHLDIAGPAFSSKDQLVSTKGATGFGVRTFLRYISSL